MRQTLSLILVLLLALLAAPGCAHMGDPCEKELVNRVKSPDGSHVISVYRRKCSITSYTSVALEKPRGTFQLSDNAVCSLFSSLGDRDVRVEWKDSQNLLVVLTDDYSSLKLSSLPRVSCQSISIEYQIPGYPPENTASQSQAATGPGEAPPPPPPLSSNESVSAPPPVMERPIDSDAPPPQRIRAVLNKLEPCLEKFPGVPGDDSKDLVDEIEEHLDKGTHSFALDLMIRFSNHARCEMTDNTYEELLRLSELYNQRKPSRNSPRQDPN